VCQTYSKCNDEISHDIIVQKMKDILMEAVCVNLSAVTVTIESS